MLKEISTGEALRLFAQGEKIIAVSSTAQRLYHLEELIGGLRFLIDEVEQKPKQNPKKTPEEKKDPEEKKEKKATGVSKEQEILKAWNGGERSIKEIMEMTGASYATVRRWIPVTPEG